MGIISFVKNVHRIVEESEKDDNPKKQNVSDYSDEELDLFGLTEEEKDLVRSDENNPWDFDEYVDPDEDYSSDRWNN